MLNMLIEEKDVTPVNLSVELERAVIAHRLEENESLYVIEDGWFPFWIRVNRNGGLVNFRTFTNFRRATGRLDILEICNRLNREHYMITAYVEQDRICFDHVLNFRNGLLRETFVRGCRQFIASIDKGLRTYDPDFEIILPPGKTEALDSEVD